MEATYPRLGVALGAVSLLGAAITEFAASGSQVGRIYYSVIGAVALMAFLVWGYRTVLFMTRHSVTVDLEANGDAVITKKSRLVAVRRNITELLDRFYSDGRLRSKQMKLNGVLSKVEQDVENAQTLRLRQQLRSELKVFRLHEREIEYDVEAGWRTSDESYEFAPLYPIRRASVTISFPRARHPQQVSVFLRKPSAFIDLGTLIPQITGDPDRVAVTWEKYWPDLTSPVRFEWHW